MCPECVWSKQTTLGLGSEAGSPVWRSQSALHADHLLTTAPSLRLSPLPTIEPPCCAVAGVPLALAVAQAEDGAGCLRSGTERRCRAGMRPAPSGVRE